MDEDDAHDDDLLGISYSTETLFIEEHCEEGSKYSRTEVIWAVLRNVLFLCQTYK